ncbi:MAG: DUF3737 family protein [Sporolactobacillus sp.]
MKDPIADGESPLKEIRNIEFEQSIFQRKYPVWYCRNIKVDDSILLETAVPEFGIRTRQNR